MHDQIYEELRSKALCDAFYCHVTACFGTRLKIEYFFI